MQQLATNLVLLLEKQALQAVEADLLNRQGRSSNDVNAENELANVKLDDLSLSLLLHMNPLPLDRRPGNMKYTKTNAFYIQILAIVAAFDAVDIDNRGVVSFVDFTNFCLRVGRLLLKPSMKHTLRNYLPSHDNKTTLYPSDRMKYVPHAQMLFVFDSDNPRVRLYNRDEFVTRLNPILAAKKALHSTVSSKLTYYEKMALEKQATQIRITEKELDDMRGSLLDAVFIDSTKQYVFTSTHSYLIFIDGLQGLYDDKGEMKVVGHIKTTFPMHSLSYSKVLDLLIAVPGEGSDHVIEMYEPRLRKLKFRISKHDTKVLSLCEVILDKSHPSKDHYFVSSSLDGKLLFWPTAPLSAMMSKLHTQRMLRMAETVDYDLKGHHHAIHSVVYASHQEIIIGAGFDFEIMAWDPFTRDMCMKFAGHFKSIAGIQIVYTPEERLLSIDESGTLKLWNVSKELGVYGSQEHSFQLHCQQPAHIKGFTRTYGEGRGLAILAEKLYFLNLENDFADDLKPILIGACPTAGRVFTVFKSSIHLVDLIASRNVKSLSFLDPDRVSSTDQLMSRGDELRMHAAADSNLKGLKIGVKSAGHIDIKDTVTACAMDAAGKKVIIGTMDGRVLLFDSFTFGLLKQLTDEEEDNGFRHQGSVAGLEYIDRDELVVAAYSAGAVKIFGGCLRPAYAGPKHSLNRPQRRVKAGDRPSSEEYIPLANGGKPPARPFLLRECDLGVLPDFSVRALAVSESQNLIAVLTKTGLIYFYDYLNLLYVGCISIDHHDTGHAQSHGDSTKQFVAMRFAPLLPLLLVVDSTNAIHAWSVRPMPFKFLLSWNAAGVSYESRLCSIYGNLHWHGLEDLHSSHEDDMMFERFQPMSGTSITTMRCISFLTHCVDDDATKSETVSLQRKWILVLGNDFGQIFTQNITDLANKSCCIDYIPRPDAFYLAYNKMKPKRYIDANTATAHTAIPRIRMPDELVPKLQPIYPEDTADVALQVHHPADQSKEKSPVKLTRQQTRKNVKALKSKKKLEGPLHDYVQGLEGWQVFQSLGVRELCFYDPFFEPDDRFTRHHSHVADLTSIPDRLPCMFAASDQGQLRLMTLSGVTLGDALEELLETTTKGPKDAAETQPSSTVAGNAIPNTPMFTPLPTHSSVTPFAVPTPKFKSKPEDHALKVLQEATKDSTFITSVIPVVEDERSYLDDNGHAQDKTAAEGPTATVYVKTSRSLMARKISIQPKSKAFDYGTEVRAGSIGSTPTQLSNHAIISVTSRKNLDSTHISPCPFIEEPSMEAILRTSLPKYINPPTHTMMRAPWLLPMMSFNLVVPSGEGRDKDVLTVSPTVKMTTVQYLYMKDILGRLLPAVEHEIDARFRARFESFAWDGTNSFSGSTEDKIVAAKLATMGKQHSTYMSRFASAENLLQGLNSFLIEKQIDEKEQKEHPSGSSKNNANITTAAKITTMHEKAKGVTRESVLEKIIMSMSDREQHIAELLQAQNTEKWARKNLSHLIDHIQQSSEAFPSQTQFEVAANTMAIPKSAAMQNGIWRHYEKEKARGRRAPWEVSQHHAQLDYSALKDEYFNDGKGATMRSSASTHPSDTMVLNAAVTTITQTLTLDDPMVQVMELDPLETQATSPTELSPSPLPARARPMTASSIRPRDTAGSSQRPRTANAKSRQSAEQTKERPHTAPSHSRSMPQLFPTALSSGTALSSSPSPQRTIERRNKIDKLIGDLDAITMGSRSNRPSTANCLTSSTKKSGLSRPQTAPPQAQDSAAVQSPRVEVVVPGVSRQLAFASNKDRVEAIHGRFEDIMLTLKSTSQPYAHYDPLRQKRISEIAKNRRKLQLRLKVSQEGNTYVEDERFEGIVDVEKEIKKAESKHLLAQSRATGRKTGYGLYKYADLIKFLHFLQFLHPLEVSIYERNVMYYYDEAGTDVSKYVRDQPYYSVAEVLQCVEELLGDSQPAKVLFEALVFYRDEVPRSNKISLFNLIEVVFAMSKGWGVQLRIYMFVILANHLYALMRSALPPPDQRNGNDDAAEESPSPTASAAPSPSRPSSPEFSSPFPSRVKQNLFNQVQSSRTPQQTPRALEKQNTQSTLESLTAPPESTAANNETGDAIEEEEPAELPIIATPVTPVAPAQPAAQTVAAPRPSSPAGLTPHAFAEGSEGSISVEKFIIHPHPLRGFRQWIVRRKAFNTVVKVLNFWCDGSMESLTIHDLVEIFHSMVPRAQLEHFRIMRVLPTLAQRLSLGLGAELNGAALTKIFQNALEVKIVSD